MVRVLSGTLGCVTCCTSDGSLYVVGKVQGRKGLCCREDPKQDPCSVIRRLPLVKHSSLLTLNVRGYLADLV